MPFRTFNNWLFDGIKDSPIPKPKNGVDILKYNSPITHTFLVAMFLRNGYLNSYLNKYFNDINLRYLSKEELFKFIKKCVIDFRIKKRDIVYYPRRTKQILYEKLREKIPTLKNDDILMEKTLLFDCILQSDALNCEHKSAESRIFSLRNLLWGISVII